MYKVNKPAIIITVILGIITILSFVYLRLAGMYIIILWFIIPVLVKKLMDRFLSKDFK